MADRAHMPVFQPLSSIWHEHEDVIKSGRVVGLGIDGACLEATVVFADMIGFTAMTNTYPTNPGIPAFVAHHFFSLIENWLLADEGTMDAVFVDKVLGDGVLFVIPGPREVSGPAAARLTATIVGADSLYPASVGVQSGEVCLCDIGLYPGPHRRRPLPQITVMGAAVNLAARLADVAARNQVAVLAESLDAYGLDAFDLESEFGHMHLRAGALDTCTVKGFGEEALRVQRLLGPAWLRTGDDRDAFLASVAQHTSQLPRIQSKSELQRA